MFPRFLATICMLLFCLDAAALAQAPSGEISGVVADTSGAPMPGVTITLTNQSTDAVREIQTNESGLYVLPAIPPGVYTLKATLTGSARWSDATSPCRWAARAASRSRSTSASSPRWSKSRAARRCCRHRIRRWARSSRTARSSSCR
jgi:hypothetical protein